MKFLKSFYNQQHFEQFKNSENYFLPNVSMINGANKSIEYKKRFSKLKYIGSTSSGGQYISLGNELALLLKPNDEVSIEIKYFLQGNGKDNHNQASLFCFSGQDYGYYIRKNSTNAQSNISNNFRQYCLSSVNNLQSIQQVQENTVGFVLKDTYDPLSEYVSIYRFRLSPITFFTACTVSDLYRWGEGRIYWCKIYLNNNLYYDLIPMIDNQTNQIGLYCNVHNCLYPGQGDANLIYEI